jgi:hypothetical protein
VQEPFGRPQRAFAGGRERQGHAATVGLRGLTLDEAVVGKAGHYGLNAGIIDRTQFSLLVTVVVLSAIVPTAIAQRWFSPDVELEAAREAEQGRRRSATRAVPAEEIA